MGKRIRPTSGLLALVVALLVALAVIPAFGDHLPSGGDEGGAGILRLHVGSDDRYFQYEPVDGASQTQAISETRCEVDLAATPELASLAGNARGAGLNGISIGVKSGGAQGVPCGRVDPSETLTLGLEDVPLAAAADLDLELKGDAKVRIETYLDGANTESFEVRSGGSIVLGEGVDGTTGEPFSVLVETDDSGTPETDEAIGNCKNLSDSGPDAGSRDNCRVTVHPSLPFDAIKLVPTVGEVSLEGSGDFGNDPAADTLFYLTTWQGNIVCDQTVTDTDGDVSVKITRLDYGECEPKLYRLIADAEDENVGSVIFEFDDPAEQAEQSAFYRAEITFKYDLSTTVPLSGVLEYDHDRSDGYTDFKEMPACVQEPFNEDGSPNPDAIPTATDSPDGEDHEGCVIEATQDWEGFTTWDAIFMGDWKFR